MKTKKKPWHEAKGLKPITGFLTPSLKNKLRRLATMADKSLSRYVTRLLEEHIRKADAPRLRDEVTSKGNERSSDGKVDGKGNMPDGNDRGMN